MVKFFVFLMTIFVMMGCKTQTSANVTPQVSMNLQIVPDYNGAPLVMYKTYTFNGKPIQFTRFSFILSRLCGSASANCQNRQMQFDFAVNTDSVSALKGLTNSFQTDPTALQNIVLGFGVDSISNAVPPAQQNQNSPLANGLNYWDAWNSYIFLKIEGMYDKDGDGVFETPFALHTGGNPTYSEKTFNLNNNFTNATSLRLLFNVNLAKIINDINLNVTTQTHKSGDLPLMQTMMNNFNVAFIYKGSFIQ